MFVQKANKASKNQEESLNKTEVSRQDESAVFDGVKPGPQAMQVNNSL